MLRIGLIGASRIAPAAVIAPASQRSDVLVTAVAARDVARARTFARTHGVPTVSEHYAALINRDDVDLVYISTPPVSHAQWTIAALEAGKHVLCEKPFCMNADEAVAMVAAAQASGKLLIEAYHYRFHDIIGRLAEAYGAIGPVERLDAVFNVPIGQDEGEFRWSKALGGGALMDLGVYPLHIMRTLTGLEPKIDRVEATWEAGVDASLYAELSFGDISASLSTSMVAERPEASVTARGAGGEVTLNNFVAPQLGHRLEVARPGSEPEVIVIDDAPSTYDAQLAHVVNCVEGGRPPLTGGADAVAQMRSIDTIYAHARA